MKLQRTQVTPFSSEEIEMTGEGFHFKGNTFVHHTTLPNHESAFRRFSGSQILFILGVMCVLFLGMLINWHATIVISVAALTVLYFVDLLFNLFLIIISFSKTPEIEV